MVLKSSPEVRQNIKTEPDGKGGNKLQPGSYRLLREYDNFITSLAHFVNYGFSLPTLQLKTGFDNFYPRAD